MSTDLAGPISLAIRNFRVLLGSCPVFRTWVGAANQSQAEAKIYTTFPTPADGKTFTVAELETLRPYAMVELVPENGLQSVPGSDSNFKHSGRLSVYLIADVDTGETYADAKMLFDNAVGEIYHELGQRALNNTTEDTYLTISNMAIASGPGESADDNRATQGREFGVHLYVDWEES